MSAERSFRLGYSTITWGGTPDLEKVFGTIANAGWEGVEFISVSTDWLGTPKRLRGLLDKHGLPPVCMFGSASLGNDAEQVLERQRRIIEYAAELGCSVYCLTGASRVALRLPTDDEFKRLTGTPLLDDLDGIDLTPACGAIPARPWNRAPAP